jgi:hypothetical protein
VEALSFDKHNARLANFAVRTIPLYTNDDAGDELELEDVGNVARQLDPLSLPTPTAACPVRFPSALPAFATFALSDVADTAPAPKPEEVKKITRPTNAFLLWAKTSRRIAREAPENEGGSFVYVPPHISSPSICIPLL